MSYYSKLLALEVYIPVAAEAADENEAKELIEGIWLGGRTVKIYPNLILKRLDFEEDIPSEISEQEFKRTYVKVK